MKTSLGILAASRNAFSVAFRYLYHFLALAMLMAVPASLIHDWTMALFSDLTTGWLPAHGVIIEAQQAAIIGLMVADLPVFVWTCIAGAFVAPAVIHIYMKDTAGEKVTVGDTINYSILAWRRVIWPTTLASIFIMVGSIIVVPGVLYTLFFAFVAAVATLDPKARSPLMRSQKLTRGRRGRIFRTYLLFVPWWGWYLTVGPFILMEKEWFWRMGANVANEFIAYVIAMALLQFYLERMDQLRQRLAERDAASAQT